jgi:hypothetical protein
MSTLINTSISKHIKVNHKSGARQMKIYQSATTTDPTQPSEIATKRYVDQQVVSGAIIGGVFFTDISPTSTGIVGAKAYVANTVPANKVITDGTADTQNVRVSLVAEGGSAFYSPTITITTVPALPGTPVVVNLAEDTYDKRMFAGFVDLTGVTADTVITATSSTNATARATVHVAAAGPSISSLTIGAYPGSQTEAKNNDVMPITGVVPNTATYVEVIVAGAAKAISSLTLGAADSAGAGFKTVTGTFIVGASSGSQKATARARNTLGTYGANFQSGNSITLNQTFPTIGARTLTYPATQSALKGSETVSIASTVTNADTVAYTSSADLSVSNANLYEAVKTVTRVGGSYVIGTNNYTITATKASNGAIATASSAVTIANAAATASVSITGNPSRLVSTPGGVSYTVNITPNQLLSAAPTMAASSGTLGGSWTFSAGVYSNTLLIKDTDVDGAQLFGSLVLVGLAKVQGTTITSGANYSVGGFQVRTITFPAFQQFAAIGTNVVDITKTIARYSGVAGTLALRSDTTQFSQGYTITDASGNYNPTGGYLFITDGAFAGSNTSGTLQLDIEEVA